MTDSPAARWRELSRRLLVGYAPGPGATEPNFRSALTEAAAQPGGLVRAALILMGAEQHALPSASAHPLACAIEYWHHASLILDDLPSMDDGEFRRGAPCLHRTYGEATAMLAALGLINRAYSLVQQAFAADSLEVRKCVMELVDQALGAAGILDGQARDVHFQPGSRSTREVGRVAWRKTGSLLWLALSLPLIPSGAWHRERGALRGLAVYWALAYQAMDDLLDAGDQSASGGKTVGRDASLNRPSLVGAIGIAATRQRIERQVALAERLIEALCRRDQRWRYLAEWHERFFASRIPRFEPA